METHLARPPQPAPEQLDEVPLHVAAGALAAEDAVLTNLRAPAPRAAVLAPPARAEAHAAAPAVVAAHAARAVALAALAAAAAAVGALVTRSSD